MDTNENVLQSFSKETLNEIAGEELEGGILDWVDLRCIINKVCAYQCSTLQEFDIE